jgi:hypothetical protein
MTAADALPTMSKLTAIDLACPVGTVSEERDKIKVTTQQRTRDLMIIATGGPAELSYLTMTLTAWTINGTDASLAWRMHLLKTVKSVAETAESNFQTSC